MVQVTGLGCSATKKTSGQLQGSVHIRILNALGNVMVEQVAS